MKFSFLSVLFVGVFNILQLISKRGTQFRIWANKNLHKKAYYFEKKLKDINHLLAEK